MAKKIKNIAPNSAFDGMSCGQLALQRAGIKVNKYYASEVDEYAISVAQHNFPCTIQMGDVTKLRASDFPEKIDLMIGGSPCQGFSFAGKQLAFDDPRSRLFFEYLRLLDDLQRYKMLGNGWTVGVIAYFFSFLPYNLI